MPMIPSDIELEKRKNEGKGNKRPNFGENQIKDLKEIKPDLVLIKMPENKPIKILTEPYKDKNGNWWIHIKFPDKQPKSMLLADVSVVPYPSGVWNKENWLSRS